MSRSWIVALAMVVAWASPASAAIVIFSTPPFPSNPQENVLLNTNEVGMVIHGETNQTHTPIIFTGNESLVSPPQGQARIEAGDGAFTFLDIAPGAPWVGFSKIEFNLDATAGGNVQLNFFNNMGPPVVGNFVLAANGQNFFTAVADAGWYITHVGIVTTPTLADVQQVRVTGLNGVPAIPEPTTWAMLIIGFGMVGAGLRMRRRAHGLPA